jgi:hypothetical protein
MKNERQLLCTFSNLLCFKKDIERIGKQSSVYNNSFFVFSGVKNQKELYITYNVLCFDVIGTKYPNTISIHRKKQTNTLYTLNAMNQLIKDENEDVLDKTFKINWDVYKNSLIITNDFLIKIIPIQLYDIIN